MIEGEDGERGGKRKRSFPLREKIINCSGQGNPRTEVIAVTSLQVPELRRGNGMEQVQRNFAAELPVYGEILLGNWKVFRCDS